METRTRADIGREGSLFEAFNARALTPDQVAVSFVPPEHFYRLIRAFHSVVVGPRGSGKTTLLKMLQQPALEAWADPSADEVRTRIDYTGVFIPTDVNWKAQVEAFVSSGFSNDHRELLSKAVFVTHVLRALVVAMQFRVRDDVVSHPHRRVSLSEDRQSELVNEIADLWHIRPVLSTLSALRRSLTGRLQAIRELVAAEMIRGSRDREERLAAHAFLLLPLLDSCISGLEVFNDACNEQDGKWAFRPPHVLWALLRDSIMLLEGDADGTQDVFARVQDIGRGPGSATGLHRHSSG